MKGHEQLRMLSKAYLLKFFFLKTTDMLNTHRSNIYMHGLRFKVCAKINVLKIVPSFYIFHN